MTGAANNYMTPPTLLVLVFVAATLPMVISVFAALLPSARTRSEEGYFLYERALDLDSFLKTSVGYSLQAASIYLLFLWGVSYGLWAIIVPLAWGIGYLAIGKALLKGRFDAFLAVENDAIRANTIHGHIWMNLKDSQSWVARIAVLAITLATVIGLGGTLMAEVDYGSKFFLAAAKLNSTPDWSVHLLVVAFSAFYVLWGGYRAVVVTDRVQIPLAYGAFGIFTLGLASLLLPHWFGEAIAWSSFALFASFLLARLKVLPKDDAHNRAVAWLTFIPLIFLAVAVIFVPTLHGTLFQISTSAASILIPETTEYMGFGIVGAASLGLANGVWQFIDISSLQRLKSLKIQQGQKVKVVRGIYATGWEACGGWVIILLAAYALRALGVTEVAQIVPFLNDKLPGLWVILLPIFIFSVVVFVLSTISGFVSAISYVAYYDLLKLAGLRGPRSSGETKPAMNSNLLKGARLTSVIMVAFLYGGYQLLIRHLASADGPDPGELISKALYAIYAFQLAIAPTVFYVLFSRRIADGKKLSAYPVLISTGVGLFVAKATAMADGPWLGIPMDSWYVFPPLAVLIAGVASFAIAQRIVVRLEANRAIR